MKESRIFEVYKSYEANNIIFDRESFGWELGSIAFNKISMNRNTSIKYYDELRIKEKEYDISIEKYYKYAAISSANFILYPLLIVFILLLLVLTIFMVKLSVQDFDLRQSIDPSIKFGLNYFILPLLTLSPTLLLIAVYYFLLKSKKKAKKYLEEVILIVTGARLIVESIYNDDK